MKVQIKRLIGKSFELVPLSEIVGTSINMFCCRSQETIVVAMFQNKEDKKPSVIFSNDMKYVKQYKEKMPSFYAPDVADFMAGEVKHSMIAKVFDGADFIEINRLEEQKELPLTQQGEAND